MTRELFDVSGQVVLVSGGSRGIGLAIAEAFAAEGAEVVITGRSAETLEAAVAGKRGLSFQVCDVEDERAVIDCVAAVLATHDRIDTLVNCAGVNNRKKALDYTDTEIDQIFDINLGGALRVARAVGRQMVAQGSGAQINIDSLSSHAPLPQIVPYAMSKSAIASMTRGLAMEWGPAGVRVNSLAPRFILTDLTAKLWAREDMQAWHRVSVPLKRLGRPSDLIGAALFLAAPASAWMTGQVLRVDGGASAGMAWPIGGEWSVREG